MSATIRYNGSVIATVAAGESKILECAEKKMAGNVAVELPEGYVIPEGTVSITENGTHDVSGYASAEVNVPSEEPVLQTKEITITENGTFEYTPDSGYDGLGKIVFVVDVTSADSGGGSGASLPETGVDSSTGEITDTWEQIQTAISSGVYSTRYAVGNYKTITLTDGTTVDMQIVAFDADEKADGTSAAITWISKGIITSHEMNAEATDAGGWEASEMRTWLQGDFYATLPDEVKDVIVGVNKSYLDSNGGTENGGTPTTETCADTIWLPSYREVFGNSTNSTNLETSGADYTGFFIDSASRIKYNSGGSASYWWLRSACYLYNLSFWFVQSSGYGSYNKSNNTYGVVFGFCT